MLAVSRVDCSRVGECNRLCGLLSIVYLNWQGVVWMALMNISVLSLMGVCSG